MRVFSRKTWRYHKTTNIHENRHSFFILVMCGLNHISFHVCVCVWKRNKSVIHIFSPMNVFCCLIKFSWNDDWFEWNFMKHLIRNEKKVGRACANQKNDTLFVYQKSPTRSKRKPKKTRRIAMNWNNENLTIINCMHTT